MKRRGISRDEAMNQMEQIMENKAFMDKLKKKYNIDQPEPDAHGGQWKSCFAGTSQRRRAGRRGRSQRRRRIIMRENIQVIETSKVNCKQTFCDSCHEPIPLGQKSDGAWHGCEPFYIIKIIKEQNFTPGGETYMELCASSLPEQGSSGDTGSFTSQL